MERKEECKDFRYSDGTRMINVCDFVREGLREGQG